MNSWRSRRQKLIVCGAALTALLAGPNGSAAQTTRVSVTSSGGQANGRSFEPVISTDGRVIGFTSNASDLVTGDTNGNSDVFLHSRETGQTVRVSVSTAGNQANSDSFAVAVNADGTIVGFTSNASNLVGDDGNNAPDVFVRTTGGTSRVSVSAAGTDGNGASIQPSLNDNGQLIAFSSSASNLVAGDSNGQSDVFVRDMSTGITSRISVGTGGQQGNGWSDFPSISADGLLVVFRSDATNLVANDTNGSSDIFVHNRGTGVTTRVSVATGGAQANGHSFDAVISADGRVVAFVGHATNLVASDTNSASDIFVHDLQSLQTTRVSVASDGAQGNLQSECPSLSADGRFVAYDSTATNLVPGDTNSTVDVFLHDRTMGETTLVSVGSGGTRGNGMSSYPDVSGTGGVVVFDSFASNLVIDTNDAQDIFLRVRDVPEAPSNLTVQISGSDVTLNWTAPTSGGPVETYLIRVVTASGPIQFVTNSTATSFRATNVPPGTYLVQVHARNFSGTGPPSNEIRIGSPHAPASLIANVSGTNVTLTWTPPVGGTPPETYIIGAGLTPLSTAAEFVVNATATRLDVANVPPGTYFVRVTGRNHFGTGPSSNEVQVVVNVCTSAPQPPTGLTASVLGNDVRLAWIPSQGCAATSYVVEVGSSPGASNLGVFVLGNVNSVTATNVPPGIYYVRVRGRNAYGISGPSNEVQVPQ